MHRKVIGVHKYRTTVNLAITGHHAITRNLFFLHSEIGATVIYKLVQLIECPFIQQGFYAFACGHPPGSMLFFYLINASTLRGTLIKFFKLIIYFCPFHTYSSFIISNVIKIWLLLTESPSATKISLTTQSELTL